MFRAVFGYRCPECAGKFAWKAEDEPPERCPLCNAWVSEDEPTEFVPKAPAIRKMPYVRSVDQTYRAMESASIERANEAAGMLESEYASQPKEQHDALVRQTQKEQVAQLRSELKITNMKDPSSMREGDTAHMGGPVGTTGAGFQPYGGSVSGAQVSPAVPFIKQMTSNHSQRAIGMVRAGNMNPRK